MAIYANLRYETREVLLIKLNQVMGYTYTVIMRALEWPLEGRRLIACTIWLFLTKTEIADIARSNNIGYLQNKAGMGTMWEPASQAQRSLCNEVGHLKNLLYTQAVQG
jgi:V8-like Glu-specific endopeptidase